MQSEGLQRLTEVEHEEWVAWWNNHFWNRIRDEAPLELRTEMAKIPVFQHLTNLAITPVEQLNLLDLAPFSAIAARKYVQYNQDSIPLEEILGLGLNLREMLAQVVEYNQQLHKDNAQLKETYASAREIVYQQHKGLCWKPEEDGVVLLIGACHHCLSKWDRVWP